MKSKGQGFSIIQENGKLKLLNSINEDIISVIPKNENRSKMLMVLNDTKEILYYVSIKFPQPTILLKGQKEEKKTLLAKLDTKVQDGNKFKLSIVGEGKYGTDRSIEFMENGTTFYVIREGKVVCEFQSNKGPVGTSGGQFRIASGELRNFTIAIVTLVLLMQIDAHSGSKSKDIGKFYEDTAQMPKGFLKKSGKSKGSNEMISNIPQINSMEVDPLPKETGTDRKSKTRHSAPNLVTLEKDSRNTTISPKKEDKELPKKKKNNKVSKKKMTEESLQSPSARSITIPRGDSYSQCWDELEAIVAQSERNQT